MPGSDREVRRDALQLLAARIEGLLRLGGTAEEEPAVGVREVSAAAGSLRASRLRGAHVAATTDRRGR